ncbi:hypothetical protein BWI93_19180 [Siphonobacter sp. BAB-5385]|uniref:P27 family phage terminase small subunit n=1 Tax=Siphonobacter sp. BAB-5385 TaxID=1864822 RepID=UPI000B9E54BF|nr:P27 family phage terminase small subunit [Siphonobacter sp. BAB-5385]OZI06604.1 hypothetical protein BWI93_19180 [Siphonobacter sp. BAB-5385]
MALTMLTGRPNKRNEDKKDQRPSRMKESAVKTVALNVFPKPSRRLGKYGKKYWQTLREELGPSKIVTAADIPLLESACIAYNVYCELEDEMNESVSKRFTTTALGGKILSAESIESKRQLELAIKILQQYGVTPLSRMRIRGTEPAAADPLGEFRERHG